MKQQIILATNNQNKLREFQEILGDQFDVKTIEDLGDIEETGGTLEENARIKVKALKEKLGETDQILIADDTGLFVDAADGEPGIHSARYAGDHDSQKNREKLLKRLEGVDEEGRTARFMTSLAMLTPKGRYVNVIGKVEGKIAEEERGENGFGYDSIFIENQTGKTFAEMSKDQKNRFSHRRKAIERAKTIIEELISD